MNYLSEISNRDVMSQMTRAQQLAAIIEAAGWTPQQSADRLAVDSVQQMYTYKYQAAHDDFISTDGAKGQKLNSKRGSQPSKTMVKLALLVAAVEGVGF